MWFVIDMFGGGGGGEGQRLYLWPIFSVAMCGFYYSTSCMVTFQVIFTEVSSFFTTFASSGRPVTLKVTLSPSGSVAVTTTVIDVLAFSSSTEELLLMVGGSLP